MKTLLLRLLLPAVLLAGTAQATPTVYTTRAAFDAALAAIPSASAVTEDFGSVAGFDGTYLPDSATIPQVNTVGSLTLTSPSLFGVQVIGGDTQLFNSFGIGATTAERTLTFSNPSPAIGFGLDLVDGVSDQFRLIGLGVTEALPAAPSFIGVIDPAATTLSFSLNSISEVLSPLTFDNVTFVSAAGAAPVPEPASAGLFAVGLAALGWVRRRRV